MINHVMSTLSALGRYVSRSRFFRFIEQVLFKKFLGETEIKQSQGSKDYKSLLHCWVSRVRKIADKNRFGVFLGWGYLANKRLKITQRVPYPYHLKFALLCLSKGKLHTPLVAAGHIYPPLAPAVCYCVPNDR